MASVYAYQCFSKNKFPFNIGALGIKFFQKTSYSHYALALFEKDGRITFFDSTMYGVRENSVEDFSEHYDLVSGFEIDEITHIDFYEFFNKHRGKSYGFAQVIGLLAKIFNIVKNNPFGSGSKRIICNELVILYTNHRGLTNIKDTDSLDLNDTENLLKGLR